MTWLARLGTWGTGIVSYTVHATACKRSRWGGGWFVGLAYYSYLSTPARTSGCRAIEQETGNYAVIDPGSHDMCLDPSSGAESQNGGIERSSWKSPGVPFQVTQKKSTEFNKWSQKRETSPRLYDRCYEHHKPVHFPGKTCGV
ncbi:hypothetical protein CC80DRAFT_117531 [Byssothecium circinans]|uniref:Uncharacterized protein n=1 Tax=Byssothecium circinans TaxID=147558 RepID=A0A6A5TVV7_9PLEO|nr:hypothetical protein CC80DRAFT_117531 [Byssothecium circinans]